MDTPETIGAPDTPRKGVSPVWRGLTWLALAIAVVLAFVASKYAAAVRYQRITNSAARAALSDRITSLEHDVLDAHSQIASLGQQVEVTEWAIRAMLAPDSRIVHLAPLGAVPDASAVVAESAIKGEAVLLVSGLPPAPSGQIYELWWIGPHGEATKAAAFHLDPHGAAIATAAPPPADAHVSAGEITLQPLQDANTPGGTIYFRGATAER
ncbi:MAG: anti-sigma factor domain-containing protein [Candidatus Binataceae bacterium]